MQQVHWPDSVRTLDQNTGMPWNICFVTYKVLQTTHTYSTSDEIFTTFSDTDHGRCKDNRGATSGYIVKIGTRAVSWLSKLQGIIALSSTKAEYSAAAEVGKEICWMWNLLSEMGFKCDTLSSLHIDNQSTIQVAKNLEHHGHMKQLNLKLLWLLDNVEWKLISPMFTRTEQMPVDILTKALPKVKIQLFSKMMGLTNIENTNSEPLNWGVCVGIIIIFCHLWLLNLWR